MIENYNSLKLYRVQMMENLNKFPIIWSEVRMTNDSYEWWTVCAGIALIG